jgi:hypothetical protein
MRHRVLVVDGLVTQNGESYLAVEARSEVRASDQGAKIGLPNAQWGWCGKERHPQAAEGLLVNDDAPVRRRHRPKGEQAETASDAKPRRETRLHIIPRISIGCSRIHTPKR